MGLFDFVQDVGEKIFKGTVFGKGKDDEKEKEIAEYVAKYKLNVQDLKINVDGEKANVSGIVTSQDDRERLILLVGNVEGIGKVEENIVVKDGRLDAGLNQMNAGALGTAPQSGTVPSKSQQFQPRFHTVVSGDTLSKISKQYYGDASKYMTIFEANKPMLSDPDKIYPGQQIRVPELH